MWFTRGKQQESSIVRKGRSFIARTLKGDLRSRLYESRNIYLPTHTEGVNKAIVQPKPRRVYIPPPLTFTTEQLPKYLALFFL
jgi:hypothetical protein